MAACELFLVALDLLAEEKVQQIIDDLVAGDLSDVSALTTKIMVSVKESIRNPVFMSLKERLLPILRDLLMYQHDALVMIALTLLFRLNMMTSETTAMLQEVLVPTIGAIRERRGGGGGGWHRGWRGRGHLLFLRYLSSVVRRQTSPVITAWRWSAPCCCMATVIAHISDQPTAIFASHSL